METCYMTFSNRIKKAETLQSLNILDSKLNKLYAAGIFTAPQVQQLDDKIINRKEKLCDNT